MIQLSPDSDMHFELLRDISAGIYGGGDVGEILTAAYQIQPGNFESYYSAFNKLANSVYTIAKNINSKTHPVSASDAFFRLQPTINPLTSIFMEIPLIPGSIRSGLSGWPPLTQPRLFCPFLASA
jgi:hypothetical protein